MSVLAGHIKPQKGIISASGAVSYCSQESALLDELSVLDNLKFWAAAYKTDWRVFLEKKETFFPVTQDFLRKRVKNLSGGMKKQLAIGLALLPNPAFLILDEPTAALDASFISSFRETLFELKKKNIGVLFSSHHGEELMWADIIYVLKDAKFSFIGSLPNAAALYDLIN